MDPSALALEKVALQQTLMGIAMTNIAGKSLDEIAVLELQKIETLRQLHAVEREINQYIEGR